jgi:hypothetical protein
MQEKIASVGRRLGIAAGLVLLLGQAYRNRPYSLDRPATAIANTHGVLPEFRRLTEFFVELAPAIPRGATISLLAADAKTQYEDYLNFLVALGQWPEARVVFPSFRWPKTAAPGPLPEYVAAFDEGFPDARYRLVYRGKLGTLSRKKRS